MREETESTVLSQELKLTRNSRSCCGVSPSEVDVASKSLCWLDTATSRDTLFPEFARVNIFFTHILTFV